jgi:hypothetical protein
MKRSYYSVGGQVIAERTPGGGRTDYGTDALGSVTATAAAGGTTTSRYSPYGEQGIAPGGATMGWVGSWGYRPTARSVASHYVRARHDGSSQGQWTTVDPLWPMERAYSYVRGNPVTSLDLTGTVTMHSGRWSIGLGGLVEEPCPPNFRLQVSYICSLMSRLHGHIARINDCIQKTLNASGRYGVKACKPMTAQRLKCMKEFCRIGEVWCKRSALHPSLAGVTLPYPWKTCPFDSDTPSVLDMFVDPVGGADVFWTNASGHATTGPGATFLHELLHACGVDHKVSPEVETKGEDPSPFCNNIIACCIWQVAENKKVHWRGVKVDFCPYWYGTYTGGRIPFPGKSRP